MKNEHELSFDDWKSLPWFNFSERLPEINQQICIQWAEPYDGETDCIWDGNTEILEGECSATKWKPVFIEIP